MWKGQKKEGSSEGETGRKKKTVDEEDMEDEAKEAELEGTSGRRARKTSARE